MLNITCSTKFLKESDSVHSPVKTAHSLKIGSVLFTHREALQPWGQAGAQHTQHWVHEWSTQVRVLHARPAGHKDADSGERVSLYRGDSRGEKTIITTTATKATSREALGHREGAQPRQALGGKTDFWAVVTSESHPCSNSMDRAKLLVV